MSNLTASAKGASMKHQTIWIVELQPVWPNGAGGFDWYLSFNAAHAHFLNAIEPDADCENQIGIYSIQLPSNWTHKQIEDWTAKHCDVIPRYEDTIAPATAGDNQ